MPNSDNNLKSSETDIIPLWDQNPQEAWKYWYPRVYSYFYRRINDKNIIDDLTAETLTTGFMAKNVLNFKAYLWKVAHNYLVKFINTKSAAPMIVSVDENLDSWTPEIFEIEKTTPRPHFQARKNKLLDCFNNHVKMDETDRKIIIFSIIQDKNSTEISKLLDIKPDTIRQKLKRSLLKIRSKCLEI